MNLVPERIIANIPDRPRASLPETYQNAKNALAKCDRIDECKEWADKALALAAYARQAKDEQFLAMAIRIQTRAITRAGELIAEIEPPKFRGNQSVRVDGVPNRKQAASDAGLSERQRKTALRVALFKKDNPDKYESLVEGAKPPTPSALAAMGTHRNPGRTAKEFVAATQFLGSIKRMGELLRSQTPKHIVAGMATEGELKRAAELTDKVMVSLSKIRSEIKWQRNSTSSKRKSKKSTKK